MLDGELVVCAERIPLGRAGRRTRDGIDRDVAWVRGLFPVVLDLLFSARAGSRRALLAIPFLILLWANLHGGYAVGIALILAFTAEALVRPALELAGEALAAALAQSIVRSSSTS